MKQFLRGVIIITLLFTCAWAQAVPAGFVYISGDQFMLGNTIYKLKGSNYYPKDHMWQYMWDETYELSEVQSEATMLSAAGANCVRILVPYALGGWGGGTVSPDRLNKLEQIVNIFGNLGIRVNITLFDWETTYPAAGTSRETSHYSYLTTIVNRFKDNRFVFLWDVKNEPDHPNYFPDIVANGDNWDYDTTKRNTVISWLSRMAAKIKSLDPNHPVTVGMRSDVNTPDVMGFADVAIFHSYNHIFASTCISNLKNSTTKPVLVQEFGWPSWSVRGGDFNETYMTTFYQTLLSALSANKIAGGMQWMSFDEIPYGDPDYDEQECYGLWRYDYTAKPALSVYQSNFVVEKFPVAIDLTPPAAPSNFAAVAGDTKVTLSWKTPADSDFKGVVVRYSTSGYPADQNSGTLLYRDETTAKNANASYVHSNLPNGTAYYYSIFAYDKPMDNHSAKATASATPADGVSTHNCIDAKLAANGTAVVLGRKVVTAVFSTYMYVTEPNRTGGIRVSGSASGFAVGDLVNITGTVYTLTSYTKNLEKYISATSIVKASQTSTIDPAQAIRPLFINAKSVGGVSPSSSLVQVAAAQGPYNVGMLVRLSGKITSVSGSKIVVDDGSGAAYAVTVTCPGTYTLVSGDSVTLTGISAGALAADKVAGLRSVLLRSWNDLSIAKSAVGGAKISGQVTDNNNAAISGAVVTLQPGSYSTTTDSAGNYSIDKLSGGTYAVRADAAGKVYYKYSNTLGASEQKTLNIKLAPATGYPLNAGFETNASGVAASWVSYSCTNAALFASESIKPNTDWGLPAATFSKETSIKYGGSAAQSIRTQWGSHYAAIYQQIPATIGAPYTFSAWTWRHDQWGGGNEYTWVGIDPTGGTNVHASTVVWSGYKTTYETWTNQTVTATSQSNTITVFVKSIGAYAGDLMKTVVDDATLEAWK